jgi:dTMP kinase
VFVVFEGIDGSGKSTLLAAVARGLRATGRDVVETQEPGGTALGTKIREIFLDGDVELEPLAATLLLNAARAQHAAKVIRPALSAGATVLCDRFTDSTVAYQSYGFGVDAECVRAINATATAGLIPDIVFVLDVPPGVASARLETRGSPRKDRIEAQHDEFKARVRRGFLELAALPRRILLDGTLPEATLVDVALREVLGAGVP